MINARRSVSKRRHSFQILLRSKFSLIISLLSLTGLPDLETVIIVPFVMTDTSRCDISHITNRRVTFYMGRCGLYEVSKIQTIQYYRHVYKTNFVGSQRPLTAVTKNAAGKLSNLSLFELN